MSVNTVTSEAAPGTSSTISRERELEEKNRRLHRIAVEGNARLMSLQQENKRLADRCAGLEAESVELKKQVRVLVKVLGFLAQNSSQRDGELRETQERLRELSKVMAEADALFKS